MKTWKLTNGDICLCDAGNLAQLDGLQAVMQTCENYALAALGEMLTQTDKGMPFFQVAFGRAPDTALYEVWFRKRMREVDGVVAVREFNAAITNGALVYNATIDTIYGTGQLNGGL